MLTCIICSRHADISEGLKENISATIGCEYELVVIDNSENKYSMFSAYNEGVHRAKGSVLCFMHEDIYYHTIGWGNVVENKFQKNTRIGLIGVLGSHYLPNCICNVGDSGLLSACYINDKKRIINNDQYMINGMAEVVVVDGMWLCIKRELFDSIRFDESFDGFHLYDMDICMQINQLGYKCVVINDILVEHYSLGGINDKFLENSRKFHEKWKNVLPIAAGGGIFSDLNEIIN